MNNYRVIKGFMRIGKNKYKTLPGVLINLKNIGNVLNSYQCEALKKFYKEKLIENEMVEKDVEIISITWMREKVFKERAKNGERILKDLVVLDCRAVARIEGITDEI